MYLATFSKLNLEKYFFALKRYSTVAVPAGCWFVWAFYPSLYNMVFTDFFPPARGVQRRIVEQ